MVSILPVTLKTKQKKIDGSAEWGEANGVVLLSCGTDTIRQATWLSGSGASENLLGRF